VLATSSGAAAASRVGPSSRVQCTWRTVTSTVSGKPPSASGPCSIRSPSARRCSIQPVIDASTRSATSCQATVQPAASSAARPKPAMAKRRRRDGRRSWNPTGRVVSGDDIAYPVRPVVEKAET
jgi:hypothetical protein